MDVAEMLKKKSTWAGLAMIASFALPSFGVSPEVVAGMRALILGLSVIFLRHGIAKSEVAKKALVVLLCLGFMLSVAGCNRGSVKMSAVMAGQPAPHAGYNIGPELYLQAGDPVIVTGAVLWIEGTEPNDLFGE